ncbi:PCSK1 (predicted) [Pycnogonum litorale]
MEKNNNKCGVGVAHDCTLAAIRLYESDRATDAEESNALSYKINEIDIYSNSWGPKDDGETLEGPGELTVAALSKGINEGRSSKGVLYVWASGNGGLNYDDGNCDGYASSIYTATVSAVTHSGRISEIMEKCSNTLAAVYSRGEHTGKGMVTTNVNNTCSTDFDGTSAACPIAAGIYALVLQVNPNITWRDAQHLTVWTSSYEAIRNKCVWNRNARGFLFHEKVGFGLMNAHEMVKTALKWVNVDNQHICEVNPTTRNGEIVALESSNSTTSTAFIFETDGCKSQTDSQISYLEHVVVQAAIESEYRGGLMIILFSPSGRIST